MLPGFYPVLGKSDYIKINNKKIPIWELLECQPVGWLYSLATKAQTVPSSPIIHDCGAFSYSNKDIPILNGKYVDAYWAIHRYKERSKVGDIVVCPDHLLIGENIRERQEYNHYQAKVFIQLANEYLPDRFPLAVIHGTSLKERLEVAKYFLELGYRHLGIGSLVPQAREYSTNLHIIKTIAQEVRSLRADVSPSPSGSVGKACPKGLGVSHEANSHLHIFGLCSPQYAKVFLQIGLSFDGSTFIREALAAGMLAGSEDKLIRIPTHSFPKCNCYVCRILYKYKIDPRWRNNGRNGTMGRIAHNLNQAITKYKEFIFVNKIYLVAGCGKQSTYATAAKDLYCSQHFQACRRYAEEQNSKWYILSPLHQVLEPEKIIQPYNKSPYSLSCQERLTWAQQVAEKLMKVASPGTEFVFLTGKLYREQVKGILQTNGYGTTVPMKHLAIGQQLAWINNQLKQEKQLVLNLTN
jgi:hypothetical protein